MHLTPLVSETLHLLWPARCAACDQTVPEAALFCATCSLALNPLCGVCPGCALPRHDDPRQLVFAGKRCARCLRVPLPFTTANAAFEYGETIAHAIVRMKHGKRRELARRLARLLVPSLADLVAGARLGPDDIVVPVPLHNRKLRERGFNQALELARFALLGLAHTPKLKPRAGLPRLERSLLHRTRETRSLGHASPAARFAEVAGAFAVSETERVRNRRVLLVDDVYTTGATFSECGDALLGAGAAVVHVLALARAV
ncbi:MAG TPA: phosphoribosyltransferase family protein [Polyangia bacterium]|nr:phosphoribosyltransferase family protein [Polyangia bacterium]